jgi:hypothetical protein
MPSSATPVAATPGVSSPTLEHSEVGDRVPMAHTIAFRIASSEAHPWLLWAKLHDTCSSRSAAVHAGR